MKQMRILSMLLCLTMLFAAGCSRGNNSSNTEATEATYEVVNADLGQSATYGGMTLVVDFAEEPDKTLDDGRHVMIFHVTITNDSEETVSASYLDNFCLTVNGRFYESYECCTIPAMKVLYDTYGVEAINTSIEPKQTKEGYVACAVDKKYDLIDLHYIPKTTDRLSRITVSLTESNIRKTES